MRQFLKMLILLTTLAIPAVATAGHGGDSRGGRADQRSGRANDEHRCDHCTVDRNGNSSCDRQRAPRGIMTLFNPNSVPLQILVDRELVATVAAGDTARIGPFELGEHRVVARYLDRGRSVRTRLFREDVWLEARHPARIDLPFANLAVVELSNRWIEPMEVLVDGSPIMTLPAHSQASFIADAGSLVTMRSPAGQRALIARVNSTGLASFELSLVPPSVAHVVVSNPSRRSLLLVDSRGNVLSEIRPGSSEKVTVDSGYASLVAMHRGHSVDSIQLLASPFASNHWTVSSDWDQRDGRYGRDGDRNAHSERSERRRSRRSSERRSHSRRVTWWYR